MLRKLWRLSAAWLLALSAAAAAVVPAVHAAAVEISPSVKAAFDRTAADADKGLQPVLRERFAAFAAMQESRRRDEEAYRKLRYRNEEELAVLRARVKGVNAAKIRQLEDEVKAAKSRYQPLFDAYASANRQVSVARTIGSKQLSALARAQAEALKPAVSLARQEIRSREDKLRSAKAAAYRTMKAIRATLDEADPITVQLKAERTATAALSKRVTAAYTAFSQHARKRNAPGVLDALTTLVALSGQIADRHARMTALENRVAAIHAKARGQFPAQS